MGVYNNSGAAGLRQYLNEKGFRLTEQRQAVLETILNNRGCHLSSDEIFKLVKQEHPGIGLATVYRTLPLLERMNLLSKINLDDGRVRYEACGTKEQLHHHLICMECGKVYEVEEDLLGQQDKEILMKNRFSIMNYTVKIYGLCLDCTREN